MKDKELYLLLDTSFLINLVSESAQFHERAYEFFNSFMTRHYDMAISTIAISEYAIKDDVNHLPLAMLQIIPFNFGHAAESGAFGNQVSSCRKHDPDTSRAIVLNDSKMFAQAELEKIDYVVSADSKAQKTYQWLKDAGLAHFEYLDITKTAVNDFFGELPFPLE